MQMCDFARYWRYELCYAYLAVDSMHGYTYFRPRIFDGFGSFSWTYYNMVVAVFVEFMGVFWWFCFIS